MNQYIAVIHEIVCNWYIAACTRVRVLKFILINYNYGFSLLFKRMFLTVVSSQEKMQIFF